MTSSLQGGLVLMVSTSIKGYTFTYFEKEKSFLYNNGQKRVFVTNFFALALKLFMVVLKSDRSIASDDSKGGFICNMRV